MIDSIINFVQSFLWAHAPALMHNSTPLLLVSTFCFFCLVTYYFTKGVEFAIIGLSAVLFLVPFIKFA